MIEDQDLPELKTFRRFERQLPFEVDESYGRLVTATGNRHLPIHRWFPYKESFSADLLKLVIEKLTPQVGTHFRLLDPFCGVGTTLIAAQELNKYGYEVTATGIECNPFAAFVAKTKGGWGSICSNKLRLNGDRILNKRALNNVPIPPLSSLTQGRCMSKQMTRRIVDVRNSILNVKDRTTRNALLLGLAATIESVSKVRKDGRALRIVDKSPLPLAPALQERWSQIASDATLLQELIPSASSPTVIFGDGRLPSKLGIGSEEFDLILTSPPYPNNIDYSEVYKLELWLLGFIRDGIEFLQLRKSTFRSHPTASFPDPSSDFTNELRNGKLKKLLWPMLERIQTSDQKWRSRLVIGYFSDLWGSLEEYYRCLRPSGYVVLVVGNSLHGRAGDAYLIPTDIGLAVIAESIGFSVEKILSARSFKRRLQGNHFLRESIVVLKKR